MARSDDKFMLRLPDGMRERVAEAARANGRSMNAEIVQRLEWSFEALLDRTGPPGSMSPVKPEQIHTLIRTLDTLHADLTKLASGMTEKLSAEQVPK